MTLLNLNALGVTLGANLFNDLNLTVSKGDRIGLVAANGRGKSTLMACIAGTLEPTSGQITYTRGSRVGFVTQTVPETANEQTLYEHVLGALSADQAYEESWRVDVVLADLEIPVDIQHTALAKLSGGWQRTALFAAAWITEPDILLLDEPTNHLDLSRIGLLQNWLGALPRDVPVIVTSHDRAFLDAITNRTLFLRAENSQIFSLPYSAARDALDEADAAEARRFENDLNKANQLRRQAAKLKNIGINSGSDLLVNKTKQLTDRAAKIEAAARPAHREHGAGDIRLTNSGTHAKALVAFENVPVKHPAGETLYTTGKKWINQGDRVILLGSNGTGKTRLMRLVHNAITTGVSAIKCAPTLIDGYSDQHLSQLSPNMTPLQTVTTKSDIGDQRARSLLASAGIDIRLQNTPGHALSGGQKARLAMLLLRLAAPNFYLLDEPTNHLDIEGQEMLESELISHGASCLLVSHDRQFLRNVGTRFWKIERKSLVEVDDPEAFLNAELASVQN